MKLRIVFVSLVLLTFVSCNRGYTPKPRAYFRIDFPEKEYSDFSGACPFGFESPTYGQIERVNEDSEGACWYNISFPEYKAKIHLTYLPLENNLSKHSEDVREIVYKHIIKADNIEEIRFQNIDNNVYGILYKISGNTASSLSFLATDSLNHFLTGSLYFSTIPNQDSLLPAIQFFGEDVVHLTESLSWK